jgi:hypothetical protein
MRFSTGLNVCKVLRIFITKLLGMTKKITADDCSGWMGQSAVIQVDPAITSASARFNFISFLTALFVFV